MTATRRAALSLILAACLPAATAEAAPEVGKSYPEFRLPTVDGDRTISLASYRGKKLLLIEFASW